MAVSANMPRRVSAREERELLAAAARLARAQAAASARRAQRDRLIAELLDSGARVADVADILGLTGKAVREAAAKGR